MNYLLTQPEILNHSASMQFSNMNIAPLADLLCETAFKLKRCCRTLALVGPRSHWHILKVVLDVRKVKCETFEFTVIKQTFLEL